VVTPDDVLKAISSKVRDSAQESRIRALYTRAHSGYETNGAAGIKGALETDWNATKARFDAAMSKVKKDAGL
jgi:hypothetical protein